jgi:hypothetical protein
MAHRNSAISAVTTRNNAAPVTRRMRPCVSGSVRKQGDKDAAQIGGDRAVRGRLAR